MFPDGLSHRSPQELRKYAEVLVYIAAADGELVREEIAVIEAMMTLDVCICAAVTAVDASEASLSYPPKVVQ